MLAWVMVRNEGARAEDCREGDILQVKPDSFQSGLGTQDTMSFLIIKFPDPPGYPADLAAGEFYCRPEYGVVDQGGTIDVIRARGYTIDWATKFTAEERAIIRDPGQSFAVVEGKFSLSDIVAKN